jgi:hypothetical protein
MTAYLEQEAYVDRTEYMARRKKQYIKLGHIARLHSEA